MSLLFFWILLALLFIGMPVVFALALAPTLSLLLDGQWGMLKGLVGRIYVGMLFLFGNILMTWNKGCRQDDR